MNLTNFGDGTRNDVTSGFLNVPVSAGTISGFITNTALERSARTLGAALGRRACAQTGQIDGSLDVNDPGSRYERYLTGYF